MRNHFAWENKAPGKNLDSALKQLLSYSLALSNPPILVVCDRLTIRIHTQFTGHPTETHSVLLAELDQPDKQALEPRRHRAAPAHRARGRRGADSRRHFDKLSANGWHVSASYRHAHRHRRQAS